MVDGNLVYKNIPVYRKAYSKKYYEQHKELYEVKENCECGGKYSINHQRRHEKTQKHCKYITTLNQRQIDD